jgi:hypothetical protein
MTAVWLNGTVVDGTLFEVRREIEKEVAVIAGRTGPTGKPAKGGGKAMAGIMKVMSGQAELFELIGTFRPRRGLAHLLHRGQEQANQDSDNRNNH